MEAERLKNALEMQRKADKEIFQQALFESMTEIDNFKKARRPKEAPPTDDPVVDTQAGQDIEISREQDVDEDGIKDTKQAGIPQASENEFEASQGRELLQRQLLATRYELARTAESQILRPEDATGDDSSKESQNTFVVPLDDVPEELEPTDLDVQSAQAVDPVDYTDSNVVEVNESMEDMDENEEGNLKDLPPSSSETDLLVSRLLQEDFRDDELAELSNLLPELNSLLQESTRDKKDASSSSFSLVSVALSLDS